MVNSKKMSKSSIAVIVLSILLVLSLILGFTGAWFTDKKDSGTDNKGTLTFGKIALSSVATNIADVKTWVNALPGDSKDLTGEVVVEGNSEAMYVLVTATSTGSELKVAQGGANVLALNFGAEESVDFVAVTSATLDEGETLYYVAASGVDKTLNLSGSATINKDTKNVAYKGSDKVTLNKTSDGIEFSFTVSASAVQARNITKDASKATTDAAELTAIVTALRAADAAQSK